MGHGRLLQPIVILLSIVAFYGCATFTTPTPIADVPFYQREQSKVDGEVKATVAVLSAEESRQAFGVDLTLKKIQAVWVRVQNSDSSRYWFSQTGMDPDYFSPSEAAYTYHSIFSGATYEKIDNHLREMAFRNPVAPNTTVSGFIYVNLDEGMKVVEIDLFGPGSYKFFTFFVPVPGIKADFHAVDFDCLYLDEEIVDYDEKELRTALENLPCCTTNADGTREGDPLNLVFIGSREEIESAFTRRGWLPAEQTYGGSTWKTVKSFLFGSR